MESKMLTQTIYANKQTAGQTRSLRRWETMEI